MVNESMGLHNVVADDGSFTSGAPSTNLWTYAHVFSAAGNNPYYCEIHGGPGGTGMSGTVVVGNPTPVELTSFTAAAEKNNIRLNWTTASETNNNRFEVERRIVNQGNKEFNWIIIGFVNGNGTSSEVHSYQFLDKNIEKGKFQYRLKQIDFNGRFVYSNAVEVNALPLGFELAQNYPNPFNPATTIEFAIPQKNFTQLAVYSLQGEKVAVLISKELNSGYYTVNWDAGKLSSGIYFYSLKSGNFLSVGKAILLK